MTDWWSYLNDAIEAGETNTTDTASMLRAQNDLYMVVPNNGAAINALNDNTEEAVASGKLTLGELQRCVMNIIQFLLDSPAALREIEIRKPILFVAEEESNVPAEAMDKVENAVSNMDVCEGRLDKGSIWIKADKAGLYGINVELMSEKSDRAQMLCQLCLNGEKAADIQTNGTWGKWYTQRVATVELQAGFYEMSLKHIKPGIELGHVEFVEEV